MAPGPVVVQHRAVISDGTDVARARPHTATRGYVFVPATGCQDVVKWYGLGSLRTAQTWGQ